MEALQRALAREPVDGLAEYERLGGGVALDVARSTAPEVVIDEVAASGLRGRGGAGFPTGRKWRTVAANRSAFLRSSVVVNAAEGEPGTFKDRMILRRDPYRVLEGVLIAAHAIGAGEVIVALKRSFVREAARVRAAINEIETAGWNQDVSVSVFEGPSEYLYGEETALLESIDGRHPFPRIAPPYRRGVIEVVDAAADVRSESKSAAHVELAGPTERTIAPPTLVNNAETMANVAGVVLRGAARFRDVGTADSPGSVVCTVTGDTVRHGVGEIAMGTPLRDVIDAIGGGPRPGHEIVAVMSGVANALLPAALLDTPVSYEGMQAAGSGLGSAGFIVFDDTTDLVAVAAGVSRFLAVESCGQCLPCKRDGLLINEHLERLRASRGEREDLELVRLRLDRVTRGARCYLATQHELVVRSVLSLFPDAVEAHLRHGARPARPYPIAPIVDIADDRAVLDPDEPHKQPDWTFEEIGSGQMPADRLDDHRVHAAS